MRNLKMKVVAIMTCICCIFIMGCSKGDIVSKDVSTPNSILDMIQGKYYISLPHESEDGSTTLGMICYFKDESIQMSFLPGNSDGSEEFIHISTEVEKDFVKYKIEENFITYRENDGSESEKPEGYFKIIKDENNKLTFKCTWLLPGELKLIDKEECTKIIYENFSFMRMEKFTSEFNKKFNLDIEGLSEISSNDDKYNSTKEKIGEEEAQRIVRKLLNEDCWETNGTTFVNAKEYYVVEDTEVGMDFRYLVDVYNKLEVFVQSADNMDKLIPFVESKPGTDIEGIINGKHDNNSENSNSDVQVSSFTIDDAIRILKENGYYQSRDNQYIKDNFIMRDIETGETMSEDENGMKYYTFLIDRTATDVYEDGSIKTAIDY